MCKISFNIKYNYNLLYYNYCLYKYVDSGDNISQINNHGIKKSAFLNCIISFLLYIYAQIRYVAAKSRVMNS